MSKTMNLIDISGYQAGLDLATVFAQNPIDGVIVKSTEGMGFVNRSCDPWVQWLIRNGKPWAFYHYLNASDPIAEAKRFIRDTINYFHDGVPCADYEGRIVSERGTSYLRQFIDTVFAETGVRCLVYSNLSTIQGDVEGFRRIANDGYQLWLAQYANMNPQIGFNPNPWQRGSVAPFERITMHQYSSCGRLAGYSGDLDLDIFYGDVDDWNRLAGKASPEPAPAPEPTPAPEEDWLLDWIEYLEEEKARIQAKIDELKARRA